MANKVFICPSTIYANVSFENVSRTYAAAGTMSGINPAGALTVAVARKATPLLTPTETVLVVEAKQEIPPPANPPSNFSFSNVPWKLSTGAGAQQDLTLAASARTRLDFRHNSGKGMALLYGDTSARAINFNNASNTWTQTLWDNR